MRVASSTGRGPGRCSVNCVSPPDHPPSPARDYRPWLVLLVVTATTLLRGVGEFRFDASNYWDAATWLVRGESARQNYFDLRGIFTAMTYAPAALLSRVLGAGVAGFAVLLQNSVLIGWCAGFLVPALVRPWRLLGTRGRWVGAGLAWLVLGGFAPYPLMDLYSAIAVTGALVLLPRVSGRSLVAAGALLAYAINLRPAYLPVVILLALVTLGARRRRSLWAAAGGLVVTLPQVAFNYLLHRSLSPLPVAAKDLVALQTGLAAFTVRYDTVPGNATAPQQFFCSPEMASSLGTLPTTTGELLGAFVRTLPQSALFALEKVSAGLHWPFSIPYLSPHPGADALFAVAVTAITVFGVFFLVGTPIARRAAADRTLWEAWALVVASVVGTVLTLVGAANEARFALPLVLLAACGVAGLADAGPGCLTRHRVATAAVFLATLAVVGLGYSGLAHPSPPGFTDTALCTHA